MERTAQPFAGKVALITGSSRGIGRAIAGHLAGLGAAVAVHGTTPLSGRAFNEAESLEAVAAAVAAESGSQVMAVHGDVSQEEAVTRIVGEVRARFGKIDFLVNCAGGDIGAAGSGGPGGGRPDPNDAVFVAVADIRALIDRNLMSCILMCRAVAPEMMDRKSGRIVNITSVAGLVGHENGAIYGVAKAGVVQYTRCLAAQLRPYDVAVNAIAPGLIVTNRIVATGQATESKMVKGGTLDRHGWPAEIAAGVEFLLSPLSSFVTGQILRYDGGVQLFPA